VSFLFKNFEAASRKPNMAAFGMFPADRDLDWIANSAISPTPVTVAYSATPAFELADGEVQRITLTGDVASSTFILNGGSSIPDGYQFYLRVLQDSTGGRLFTFPANVRNPANFLVGQDANIMTSFFFEYRNSGWDFSQVPVEGPVV
jgi:hypothetical protein